MSSKFFRDLPKTIRRTLFETALPLLGGGAWVLWAWHNKNSFFEALSGFGIGYLFVLSAQGQFLRVAKNVRDESDADEFRGSFASLQQGVDALRDQGFLIQGRLASVPENAHGVNTIPGRVGISHFWDYAYRSLDAGQYYAAVLLAAVGFESTIRYAALQLNLNPDRAVLNKVTREIEEMTGAGPLIERLTTLTRIRNTLLHFDSETLSIDRDRATELVESFQVGAGELIEVIDRR